MDKDEIRKIVANEIKGGGILAIGNSSNFENFVEARRNVSYEFYFILFSPRQV